MIHHEENAQISFMNYCKLKFVDIGPQRVSIFALFIHIRNESFEQGDKGQRGRRIQRAKNAGYKPGTPDLFLPLPIHGKPGLFIEMKRPTVKGQPKGRPSKGQLERLTIHADAGYVCRLCFGCDEAINVLEQYLEGNLQ